MKIFAHRGFSSEFAEGTRDAYEGAIKAGADGFECDVRITGDDQLICFHDRTTKRLVEVSKKISRLSVNEIKDLYDAITLPELLDMAIGARKDLLIETKHPVWSRGRVENRVIELLHKRQSEIHKAGINVTVMSFSYLAVRRLRAMYPNVAKVIKYSIPALLSRESKVAINIEVLRKVPKILDRKKSQIYVWTVNTQDDLNWIKKKNIAGVITDNVTRARQSLETSAGS